MFRTNDLEQLMRKVDDLGWGTISISPDVCQSLLARLKTVEQLGLLHSATITQSTDQAQTIRNDLTYWLEKDHDPIEKNFLEGLDELLLSLKNYFRISLTHLECHFAMYPKGHFYKKHIDQTADHNKRFFSFVVYLNSDWNESLGGKLVGFENSDKIFEVLPHFGQMIVFRSDIPHEVEPSLSTRRSIAGWFRV
jgi:SM-20-related protein